MAKKEIKLSWYVIWHESNSDKIRWLNIFNNINVIKGVERSLKKYVDYPTFKEEMKRTFKYAFWSKAEYEIYVAGLCAKCKTYKIDIWYQIEPNLDSICRYIIEEYNKTKRKKICI